LKKPFRPREQNKIYRDRYEALKGPSLWECTVCHRGRMIVIRAIAGGEYIWPRSIVLLRFPPCPVPPECGVLPQRLRSCVESGREFPRPRLVCPDAVVIHASSTKRRLYGAKRSLYRGTNDVQTPVPTGPHRESKTHKSRSERWRRKRGGAFFWRTISW
jgi:hypothetical protein